MRNRDTADNRTDMPDTAIIRRMRARRSLRVETAEKIYFNAAAFRLDRELGIPEHTAVERNLHIIPRWPDIVYE